MVPEKIVGLIDLPSNHTVDEAVEKLKGILRSKGITLFALSPPAPPLFMATPSLRALCG